MPATSASCCTPIGLAKFPRMSATARAMRCARLSVTPSLRMSPPCRPEKQPEMQFPDELRPENSHRPRPVESGIYIAPRPVITLPLLAGTRPAMMLRSVVLPDPEGPRSAATSPARKPILMPSSTALRPKCFETSFKVISISCVPWRWQAYPVWRCARRPWLKPRARWRCNRPPK